MRLRVSLFLFIAFIASACNLSSSTSNDSKPLIISTATRQSQPTINSTPSKSNDKNPNTETIQLWWIIQGDGGNNGLPAGCEDSIALRPSNIPTNLSMDETVKRAFSYLTDDSNQGDDSMDRRWWNPLSDTSLTMDSYTIDGDHVTANFVGEYFGGGVCDALQFQPQIALNVMTLTNTKIATINLNGHNIRRANDMSGQDTRTTYTWEELHHQFIEYWVISSKSDHTRAIQLGCESYIVPRKTAMLYTDDTLADLNTAFRGLFLYNPDPENADNLMANYLRDQSLFIEQASLEDGHLTVNIGGELQGVGVCIDPVIEGQIIQTIFQFEDIERATVMNGDINLRQFVDMSGRPSIQDHIYTR